MLIVLRGEKRSAEEIVLRSKKRGKKRGAEEKPKQRMR
jgi:hypothetical protein